jgi:hypothetical protein
MPIFATRAIVWLNWACKPLTASVPQSLLTTIGPPRAPIFFKTLNKFFSLAAITFNTPIYGGITVRFCYAFFLVLKQSSFLPTFLLPSYIPVLFNPRSSTRFFETGSLSTVAALAQPDRSATSASSLRFRKAAAADGDWGCRSIHIRVER